MVFSLVEGIHIDTKFLIYPLSGLYHFKQYLMLNLYSPVPYILN